MTALVAHGDEVTAVGNRVTHPESVVELLPMLVEIRNCQVRATDD